MTTRSRLPPLALTVVAVATACRDPLTAPEIPDVTAPLSLSVTGNGVPSGSHYNLIIIGTEDVTIDLFNACLESYLWDYTNQGLKLLQFRFYPID